MAIAAPGLGSNLDVNGIITQLMNIERQPLAQLATKEASFQSKLSAYGSLKGALSNLNSSLTALNDPSKFQAVSAKVSDTTILSASALKTAALGSYAINVTQLAQSQSIIAAGQSSTTATIGAATSTTLTIDFGTITGGTLTNGVYTGATFTADSTIGSKTITIGSSNNSLQGIRDAINAANVGVKATIVNDGGASPYRLVLQSSTTGANRSMRISAAGDATVSSLLSYNPQGTQNLTQANVAQDAAMTINGVSVNSRTNSVAGAIEGVTLTLAKVGQTNVNVDKDVAGVQTSVQAFVKAYNDLKGTMDGLSSFDAATRTGGPLLGDTALRSVESQLRQTLSGSLGGVTNSNYSVLSQIGLSFQKDGSLALDTSKLSSALANDVNAVAGLFASVGTATDSLVQASKFTANTKPGQYAINVTQMATQGGLVGPAGSVTINSGQDVVAVTLDGVTANVTLTAGTYTASEMASHLESKINGTATFANAGLSVKGSVSGAAFALTSGSYGSTSSITISGIAGTTSTAGVDVAGTIGGVTATGKGRSLTAGANSPADGLEVTISGGAVGDRGEVRFVRGYAHQLQKTLDGLIAGNGVIAGRAEGISRSIKDIDQQRDVIAKRLEAAEARYRAQFTALDQLISSMRSTSEFLAQQLATLPGVRN